MKEKICFKRKIYNKLVEWKNNTNGKTALLIEGARRIGKSTIAEEFAKNEYDDYILIDFNKAPVEIKNLYMIEVMWIYYCKKYKVIMVKSWQIENL